MRIHTIGEPEVMRWENITLTAPEGDEVLIRQQAVGLNFIDIYHRRGIYPVTGLPFTPGLEAAGEILMIGPQVRSLKVGDRVMYCKGPVGAYATQRLMREDDLLRVPQGIKPEQAAACLLRGATAYMLVQKVFALSEGMTILVHAAAGGVGSLVAQWARHLGAQVIGSVGSADKVPLAKAQGCHEVVVLDAEAAWVAKVRDYTSQRGCNVVYDGIGRNSFTGSLDCLMRYGLMVSYGQSSGAIESFNPLQLMQKGSLFLTRPTLRDYVAETIDYGLAAASFFDLMMKGIIRVPIGQSYYLSDAARAHRELEARQTTGASVFLVDDL
ncbi:MAG: quinone oxidoreductase [Rickettsiales bacterium]|nr:quinone oxidoreductase [Rickettsiales bacterium]